MHGRLHVDVLAKEPGDVRGLHALIDELAATGRDGAYLVAAVIRFPDLHCDSGTAIGHELLADAACGSRSADDGARGFHDLLAAAVVVGQADGGVRWVRPGEAFEIG